MFNTLEPGPATWFTTGGFALVEEEPGHVLLTDDSNGRSAPANVTNVLTLINLSISDNGTDYLCQQGVQSDPAFLTVFGELMNVCIKQPARYFLIKKVGHKATYVSGGAVGMCNSH